MLSQTKSMYRTQIQQALRAIDFACILYHKYVQKSSKISALSQINAGAETNLNGAVKHPFPSTFFDLQRFDIVQFGIGVVVIFAMVGVVVDVEQEPFNPFKRLPNTLDARNDVLIGLV